MAEAEALDERNRGLVLRLDVGFHAMQLAQPEHLGQDVGEALVHEALSLLAPEADRALLLHPDVDGVVLTQDTTRVAMPGLALPRAVAEAHGGSVSLGAARPRGLRLDVRLGAR